MKLNRFTTSQLKSPNLDCLLCYNVYKQAFMFENKGIYPLNRGIHLSPSEMNMRNSILQALLVRIRLVKECMIYMFTSVISVLFGVC